MRAEAVIHNPDAIELSMTFRMTVGEWKKFCSQLQEKGLSWQHPASDLFSEIQALTRRVDKELLASTPAQESK